MEKRIVRIFLAAVFLTLSILVIASAQEQAVVSAPIPMQDDSQQTADKLAAEPVAQWVWGEVTSIDPASKQITLKYVDYEADQEKNITVTANDKTTFENAKSMDDIKQGNTVSVDYIPGDNTINIAKNVSLEKPESENSEAAVSKDTVSSGDVTPADVNPEPDMNSDQKKDQPDQKAE